MSSQLTVGLAQIDAKLGALEANFEKHLAWIEKARERGVELLVFPELSLTGYRLLHLTSRVASRVEDSPWIDQLRRCPVGGNRGKRSFVTDAFIKDIDQEEISVQPVGEWNFGVLRLQILAAKRRRVVRQFLGIVPRRKTET